MLDREESPGGEVGHGEWDTKRVLGEAKTQHWKTKIFPTLLKLYLWDEHPGFIDAKRVTGMITASHDAQAQSATWLHQGHFLLGLEGKNVL